MGVEVGDFQTRYKKNRKSVCTYWSFRIAGGLAVSRSFGDFECKVGHVTGLIGEPQISEPIVLDNTTKKLIIASDGVRLSFCCFGF